MGTRIEPRGTPQVRGAGEGVSKLDREAPVGQVGPEELQGCAFDAHMMIKPSQQDPVIHHVEGCC